MSVRPNADKTAWCVSVGVTDDMDLPSTFEGLPVVSYRTGVAVHAVAYHTIELLRRLKLGPGDALYRGGVDVRGRTMQTGAYGLPVRQVETGRTFLLTAAHVIGSLSWAHGSERTDVLLAENSGVPGSGDPIVGHVHSSHPPNHARRSSSMRR